MMEALKQFEALVSAKISVVKTAFSLFCLEAKLAELSVFPLLLNICMLFVVLITVWLSAMVLAGYFVLLLCSNIILSLFIILLINVGLLFGLLKYLSINLTNMSFQKTREFFSQNESAEYEKLEEAAQSTNYSDEQSITIPEK